jgi:putative ABC transport system substrate-binding protein
MLEGSTMRHSIIGLMLTLALSLLVAPLAPRAQQPERMRRVGWLVPWPEHDPSTQATVTTLVHALEQFGWIEGKNLRIDYRFAAGDPTLYQTYAAELVGLAPDVLLAGASPAVPPLRQLTRTIPIVFVNVADPVGLGYVQSLARPGGNITGFSAFDEPMMGKWLELLKEVAPSVTRVAVIFNPETAPFAPLFTHALEAAAPALGMTVTLVPVHDDVGIERAIATQAREPGGGLVTLPESFVLTHRDVMIAAAARYRLPLMGGGVATPRAGGLMAYWFDPVVMHTQAASYIDRILKGASPAELPVQQPTKFSLIINLKTAKALGLTIPPTVLFQADEIIR